MEEREKEREAGNAFSQWSCNNYILKVEVLWKRGQGGGESSWNERKEGRCCRHVVKRHLLKQKKSNSFESMFWFLHLLIFDDYYVNLNCKTDIIL
jgi:hypothetical protein